jgi:glucose-6-phosphate isomerase/transaldolase/glucose-6-phosphate isomerase
MPVEKNPGAWLGAVIGTLAANKRDKLTLILSPKVATFGYWVEQLIAESTGKQGRGVVPVEGEPLGKPDVYGEDRLFVYVRMDKDPQHKGVTALEDAGQPVVTLTLRDTLDLGAEFFRWEFATAIAGSILGIDAFDQPNVQESKDNTKKVLAKFRSSGRLPGAEAQPASGARSALESLLGRAKAGSYVALMAYTARNTSSERALTRIREMIRDRHRVATTAGYGPRFLHSTGQLHKGGPREGVFLQIVQEDAEELPIPGQPFGFSVLKQAQALGDLQSLQQRKLPVLRVNLGPSAVGGWKSLVESVAAATR